MKRVVTPELLDTDSGTAAEIAGSLADLKMINRWFGGVATSEAMVAKAAKGSAKRKLAVLEVAAGSGFVPKQVQQRLKDRAIELDVTLLDRAPSHLNGNVRAVVGDALSLPFGNESFDLVTSTLFVHHLSPAQVVAFVDECLRVCRVAVVINDLIRHSLHMALVYAGFPLYRSRITRNDAPASVLQAYTTPEMRELLSQTKAARVEVSRRYLFRMGVLAWKH
jgi:ubiquinone/menaquinone biosynthesis C-methylase UbiE